MKRQLTKKQKDVLEFISEYTRENKYPPTLREIAKHFRFNAVGTVQGYIKALTSKGYLTKSNEQARTLTVKNYTGFKNELPILGNVSAGTPVFAPENFIGTIPCGELVKKPRETFALKVRGESMINAGILDGDFVLVQKQKSVVNNDIVVVRIDDEVTVKRFFKDSKKRIRLVPENKKMKSIILTPPANVDILGKVVGVYRKII